MHRSITALVAAGLLLLAIAVPASAAKPEASGPSCADIVDGTASYVTEDGSRIVPASLTTAAPSCGNVTYTLYVLTADGSAQLTSASRNGDGSTELGLMATVSGDHTTVCVYVTSSSPGGKVFDRGPDTGCVTLELDGGAGAVKFG